MKRNAIVYILLFFICLGMSRGADSPERKYKFSVSERFRFVSWDNAVNLDDAKTDAFAFTRHRTHLTFQWLPAAGLELNAKLTNEFRNYMAPKDRDFEIHELFVDNLYFKWADLGRIPLTLTLGRQNIMLGEGFVVMDGHALDGSRSIYFNAARADYSFKGDSVLTAFVSYVPDVDNILPVINDQEQALIEQPERGMGLYFTKKLNKAKAEAYFLRKDTDSTEARPIESGINTFGARITVPLMTNLSFCGEGAFQSGSYGDFDRSAFGGYFHLDYSFSDSIPLVKTLTVGGIALSGDDPETERHEGWDPLFSRWPKWSESYIYTLIRENGVANWSNLNSIYGGLIFQFSPYIDLKVTQHFLGAFQEANEVFPGGTGNYRGSLLIGRLNVKIDKHLGGHFVWEHFNPGDYYFSGSDSFNWLRFELMLKF